MKIIITICFFLVLSTHLSAQILDKSKSTEKLKYPNEGLSEMFNNNIHKSVNTNFSKIKKPVMLEYLYLEEPELFPLGSDFSGYALVNYSTPVTLSDTVIGFVYTVYDSLLFTLSSDSGKTWSLSNIIETGGSSNSYLRSTVLKTNSNRLLVIWESISPTYELKMAYSDNQGSNWYINTIPEMTNPYVNELTLSQTNDDKIWLSYSRNSDLFYITSTNNGDTWSNENTFLNGSSNKASLTIVQSLSSELIAFYGDNSSGNYDIYKKVSTDAGLTWSGSVPVVNSNEDEYNPKILVLPNSTIWVFYYSFNNAPPLYYLKSDIYYIKSSDGGNSWENPEKFTNYAGPDASVEVASLFNKPFISFSSTRWTGDYLVWYALIGLTADNNPPPALFYITTEQLSDYSIIINAYVDDENGISDVKLETILNGNSQEIVQMYDDGLHWDFEANDNIWGVKIGPSPYNQHLDERVDAIVSITDVSSNNANIETGFTIKPIHNVGNVILSFHSNSQLGEDNPYGTNAYYPKSDGNDYLYSGGMWIGINNSGLKSVMNFDYFEQDWSKTEATLISISPGISDQDANVFYDDKYPYSSNPIGLDIHQKSYQWSDPVYDDFIIFQYIIKNRTSDNLNDLYASLWLDPDICSQTIAYDDLGGYDSERKLIYMYDPQNNPSGYLGLRLLNETPSTAYLYSGSDPQTDDERYQYMTSGIMQNPTTPNDYRLFLTSQPFSLAPGDSHTVSFGLVMANGLNDLQTNADTMKQKFERNILVSVDDKNLGQLPTEFKLAQNYPNPFNPSTVINYSVAKQSNVTIIIYDALGREITTLVNEEKPIGNYKIEFNAGNLSSGIYFYRIQAGSFIDAKKMILMK